VGYFGIDDAASRRWWEAVCAAHDPVAVRWREAREACDTVESPSPAAVRAFLILRIPPAQVMDLLAVLVDEGQLARRRVSALEEKVLGQVQSNGTWK
jgi:hypothetical protein